MNKRKRGAKRLPESMDTMKLQDKNHPIHVERDVNIHLENKKVSMHFFWFMWFIYAVVSMTKNCFSAAMADIVAEGFLLKSETELITSLFYVVYTPCQIIGGIFSDKYSPERLIKIGLVGGAISNAVIFFFNTSYPVMLVAWLFNALVQFGLWPSIFKIVSSQCVRSERPRMLFLISTSFSAGLFLSYGVGAILPDWRMNFSISALSLLALAIALHIYDRHIDKYMKWDSEIPSEMPAGSEAKGAGGTARIFLSSGFVVLLLVVFLRDSFGTIVRRIAATMINETFELGASVSTLMSMLIVGCSLIFFFIVRELLQHKIIKNHVVGIIIGLSVALVISLLFIFSNGVAGNVISMCLMAGISTATGLFTTSINSSFSRYGKNATAAGLSNAASACGYVAPLFAVVLQEKTGSWNAVKIMLLVVAALGILLALVVLPMYNRFNRRETQVEAQAEQITQNT